MNLPANGPSPKSAAGGRRWGLGRWLVCGAGLLAAAALVRLVRARPWKAPPPEPDPLAVLPLTASPFLNTGPDVRYVGSEACVSCHEDACASFRHTGMGRSMADVDPAREPPDAVFDHPLSKRRYQVFRKDGALWHRESLLTDGGRKCSWRSIPSNYVVGSGENSRSYLIEADGFLVESPLSWYASRQAWGMAPGYDKPEHLGFMRAVGDGCLYCHAGRAETVGQSLHQMHVTEEALGCERCHGPGALHVERHKARQPSAGAIDYTIVNPAHLSRELAEAVCQQCHLPFVTAVAARGRKLSDFRPGLPLQDFLHVYQLGGTVNRMAVVGHVEQLHASRCYQESTTLTRLTCHDPHDRPAPEERTARYNAICQDCHKPESCTVDPHRRARESPDNNCVQCHMPRGDTDIPHFAFAHHRIGIHDAPPVAAGAASPDADGGPPAEAADIQPFLDLSRLGEVDRKRSLGLGYVAVSLRQKDAGRARDYQQKALALLTAARAAGLRDGDVDAALAQLRLDLEAGDALPYAESALTHPDLAGQARCDALLVFAREQGRLGNHEQAKASLLELTRLRRNAIDHLYLASCLKALGDDRASKEALADAVRINPRAWSVHKVLAEYYDLQGDERQAAWHRERAAP